MIGVPIWLDIIFSVGIIVAMVPEGLLPTLTLALVLAAQRMAKRNILIRQLTSVETLGFATVICTDKTGTLTENCMQVRELLLGLERHAVSVLDLRPDIVENQCDFFVGAGLCHDLKESVHSESSVLIGDPMEIALVTMARKVFPSMVASRRVDEIPFDTDRKRQTIVEENPHGRMLYCKGALESVLPLCSRIGLSGKVRALDAHVQVAIRGAEAEMAARGLRVLALASKPLFSADDAGELEQNLVFQGLVGFEDPPRAEVREAIRRCQEAGIKVVMVTGDHPLTAVAVAREIGLVRTVQPRVISGDQLRGLSDIGLQITLDADEVVFARVTPEQKMRIVEALMAKKHIVAVTGDGVNDAPALRAAHIGIAMGVTGTDVAKEAADMVLVDDNFASIVSAVEEGRAVFQNIRKFLTYVLVHNVAQVVPYVVFALFAVPLPLTPIQVLFVDMGSDSLTALGLGIERPDPQTMRLPPRPRDENLLNLPLALRAYLFLGPIEAAIALGAFFFVLLNGGWRYGDVPSPNDPLYMQATTACLAAIVTMQIVNVYLCRSSVRSVFSMRLLDNRLIVAGIALEVVLLLIAMYVPWANSVLATAVVPTTLWLLLVPCAVAMLSIEEFRKYIIRRALH
jgi:calcium-translocating P-type ATPase